MILWIDAQLSPHLAPWIAGRFGDDARSARALGLLEAKDPEIYEAARAADAILVTKDRDFPELQSRLGSPPRILWITCGNTSNEHLKKILEVTLPEALKLFQAGEPLVEIGDAHGV